MVRFAHALFVFVTASLPCSAMRIQLEDQDVTLQPVEDIDAETYLSVELPEDDDADAEADAHPQLPYAGIDTPGHFNCGSEYTLGGLGHETLPDLLTHAHEWCNSDLVPEDKRVPENVRGLYWMKGLSLSDVAFCGSLGEWDPETLTASLPVWSTFVVGKQPHEEVPRLIRLISGWRGRGWRGHVFGWHPLVYSLTFTNSSFTEARITPSHRMFNRISRFPMYELPVTADGTLERERPGDIFHRPSFFFGFETASAYEAVKVMYDDGTLHMDRVAAMRAAEMNATVTYMRYAPTC